MKTKSFSFLAFAFLALVSISMLIPSSAAGNPALLKKHPGYPNDGVGSTYTGPKALYESASEYNKHSSWTFKRQLNEASGEWEYRTQLSRRGAGELPKIVGPNHVTDEKGVKEGHIQKGTVPTDIRSWEKGLYYGCPIWKDC